MSVESQAIAANQYRRILDLTRALALPMHPDELLGQIAAAVCELLEADRASIFVYDAPHNELWGRVAHGQPDLRVPADRGIAGLTAQERRLVNIPDCSVDPRINRAVDANSGYRTRNLLSIPMISSEDQLVGVLQALNNSCGAFTEAHEQLGQTLAAQCAVLLQRALLIEDRLARQRLERELAIARRIQRAALPDQLPEMPGYELAAWSTPAEETGGDVYDAVVDERGCLWLLLADATGHGIGPALSVTQMRAMFRMAVRLRTPLETMLHEINQQLLADLPAGHFVTAFVGMLEPASNELHYISAGQGPILHHISTSEECAHVPTNACPLGILADWDIEEIGRVTLVPGDGLALLTDGVYEACGPGGEQFGAERVAAVLGSSGDATPDALVQRLRQQLAAFHEGQRQFDDITGVLLKRSSEARRPSETPTG